MDIVGHSNAMRRLYVFVVIFLMLEETVQLFRVMQTYRAPALQLRAHSFRSYDQIPHWLQQSCETLGFREPTEVQRRSIQDIFAGKDVVIQAHTGSGKTLAYSIPLLSRIDLSHAAIQAVVVVPTRELGLQVAAVLKQLAAPSPQRIMVMSVVEGSKNRRQMLWAAAEPPHVVVGNPKALQKLVDMGKLRLNAVDMVVLDEVDACLIDPDTKMELHKLLSRHLSSTFTTAEESLNVNVRESRVFRDLARDQQQQMGFGEKYHMKRQTIMCSATIPQRQHFAAACHKNGWTATTPELINVSEDELVPTQVLHTHTPCPPELRLACLAHILRVELGSKELSAPTTIESSSEPSRMQSSTQKAQAIVFLDEKQLSDIDGYRDLVQEILDHLPPQSNGNSNDSEIDGNAGNGDNAGISKIDRAGTRSSKSTEWQVGILLDSMSLDARHNTMQMFRDGDSRVLLCSDMAARGLDLPNTALVVQMSLPSRVETYIHRAGRTGRLNRPGKVVTFTSPEEDFVVHRYSNEIGVPIVVKRLKKQC